MDTANEIKELKEMLRKHIEEDAAFRKEVTESNKIALEFTKTECRSKIKNIFYRYEKQRVLPLYEKKTLMNIKELYIDTLHCNSYASFLLDEMDKWEVDYEAGHEIEDDASWTN